MTTLDALKLVRRWWWVLVLRPLMGGSAAYLVSNTITPIYRAQVTVLIEDSPAPGVASTYNDILKL
jgi:uncharacterized protein involved in exopolysaccharide biosynthesis